MKFKKDDRVRLKDPHTAYPFYEFGIVVYVNDDGRVWIDWNYGDFIGDLEPLSYKPDEIEIVLNGLEVACRRYLEE